MRLQTPESSEKEWERLVEQEDPLPEDLTLRFPNLVYLNINLGYHGDFHIRRTAPALPGPLQILKLKFLRNLPSNHPSLFQNLTFFEVDSAANQATYRSILEPCSTSLRYLAISISEAAGPQSLSPLEFPLLEFIQLEWPLSHEVQSSRFPSWMKVPPSSTLYVPNLVCWGIPSVSKLWVGWVDGPERLWNSCPILEVLKVEGSGRLTGELYVLLEERKANVESGVEVEGVRMQPLKKSTIDFTCLSDFYNKKEELAQKKLAELRELVDEVVDLDTEPEFEVEVSGASFNLAS